MHRTLAAFASVLAAAVLLAAPAPARAFFSLELHYGVERADATSLKHGLDAALSDTARLKNSAQIVGGLATLKLGVLELGAVADRTWKKDGPSITAVGGLAGLGFDVGSIRLEALGEAGGRRYGDFAFNRTARTRWGLRRMGLHAWKLEVPHPLTGAPLRLEAPFPAELAEVLSRANLKLPGSPTGAHAPGARRDGPHRER